MHTFDNDRVKLITIYLAEEDPETAMAAAGALAILSNKGEVVCRKILTVSTQQDYYFESTTTAV